jgi:ribosomal protein S27AE
MKIYWQQNKERLAKKEREKYYRNHEETKKYQREYARLWALYHHEKKLFALRRWREGNREQSRILAAQYKQANPERTKTHHKVGWAVKSGKIIRPSNCCACGLPGKIEAHHKDYFKPFEITWLCKKCHSMLRRIELEELK